MFLALMDKRTQDFYWNQLTPRFMRWSPEVWLLDLHRMESYLRHQMDQEQFNSIFSYLRYFLNHEGKPASEDREQNPEPLKQDYIAVIGLNPWSCLLVLTEMRFRGLSGLVSLPGSYGERILQGVSWESFFSLMQEMREHWNTYQKRLGRPQKTMLKQSHLSRDIEKTLHLITPMGIRQPSATRNIPPRVLRKRFGSMIASKLAWIYQEKLIDVFPFTEHQLAPEIIKKTHFDFELSTWDEVEPFLKRDFQFLFENFDWQDRLFIVDIDWYLHLESGDVLPLLVQFRYPCSIVRESMEEFSTLLTQSMYAFERNQDVGKHDRIVGWNLVISGRIHIPAQKQGLFISEAMLRSEEICSLENRLPVPLERYSLSADWLPERSFYPSHDIFAGYTDLPLGQVMQTLGNMRPVYIFKKPLLQGKHLEGGSCYFIEKISDSTWKQAEMEERDYYLWLKPDEKPQQMQKLWVFCTQKGNWYLHGIFA